MAACCSAPRISIIKRWTEHGVFFTIERCRRCKYWARRAIDLTERNGRIQDEMTVIPLKTSTQTPDNAPQ